MSPIRKTTSITLLIFLILLPINLSFVIVNAMESSKVEIETFDGELTKSLEEFYAFSFSGKGDLKKMECNPASKHAPLLLTVTMTPQEAEALRREYAALPIYQGGHQPLEGVVIQGPAGDELVVTVTFSKRLSEERESLQILGYLSEHSMAGNTVLRRVILSIWIPVNLIVAGSAAFLCALSRRGGKTEGIRICQI